MMKIENQYQVMPDLTAEEYGELKADIAVRGVMVPVEFDESGNVLDGHHRLRACMELGITEYPKVIRAGLTEVEKRTHARKLNMLRRQLSREQKQELIREQLRETPEKSDRQMAGALNVSPTTVGTIRKKMEESGQLSKLDSSIGADGKERPRQVERKPTPETTLFEQPEPEPTPEPEEMPRKPVSVFNPSPSEEKALQKPEIIKKMADNAITVAQAQKELKREIRQAVIEEKINATKTDAHIDIFTTDKKYRVIYADPPWSYNDKQDSEKLGGAVKHYPTMPLDEICALPIPAEKNAVLFLWVTSPMLQAAFTVINAWGFTYKSSFVWDKISHVMGHYNSVRHEFLLIAVRGSCTPDTPKLLDSVVSIERAEHSKKPDKFREMIDFLYPVGERLEMFAREPHDGWDVWGNMA